MNKAPPPTDASGPGSASNTDPSKDLQMDETQIKYMVHRFLGWPLPKDFSPDGGITAKRPNYGPGVEWALCGTNLLTATQADAMVRHMLEGMPSACANTESSPTQTVAPPGSTAGDVDRAVAHCPPDIQEYGIRNGVPEFAKATWHAGYIDGSRAARAELLAQIREPLREAVAWAIHDALLPPHENNLAIRGLLATVALRALADKLTEAT